MSAPTITYQFEFVGDYDESVFAQSQYASDSLRLKVKDAVETEVKFLSRFSQVNKIAQQVEDAGLVFKVLLARA